MEASTVVDSCVLDAETSNINDENGTSNNDLNGSADLYSSHISITPESSETCVADDQQVQDQIPGLIVITQPETGDQLADGHQEIEEPDAKKMHLTDDSNDCTTYILAVQPETAEVSVPEDLSVKGTSLNGDENQNENDCIDEIVTSELTPAQQNAMAIYNDVNSDNSINQVWFTSKVDKTYLKNNKGQVWRTGMWSKEEVKLLQQNIENYCMERLVDPTVIIFEMNKDERKDFYRTVSKGLNRPLFSVYRRVLRMYDNKNHVGKYTAEELEKLKELRVKYGKNWQAIGQEMGRSPSSIKDKCRLLRDHCNQGRWLPAEERRLADAVYELAQAVPGEIVYSGLSWSAVASKVKTRSEKQCRTKWLNYLNWKVVGGTDWSKDDDVFLVTKVCSMNAPDESALDWAILSEGWPSVRSPQWLRSKWWNLKKQVPEVNTKTFEDLCDYLYKIYITKVNSKDASVSRAAASQDDSANCNNTDVGSNVITSDVSTKMTSQDIQILTPSHLNAVVPQVVTLGSSVIPTAEAINVDSLVSSIPVTVTTQHNLPTCTIANGAATFQAYEVLTSELPFPSIQTPVMGNGLNQTIYLTNSTVQGAETVLTTIPGGSQILMQTLPMNTDAGGAMEAVLISTPVTEQKSQATNTLNASVQTNGVEQFCVEMVPDAMEQNGSDDNLVVVNGGQNTVIISTNRDEYCPCSNDILESPADDFIKEVNDNPSDNNRQSENNREFADQVTVGNADRMVDIGSHETGTSFVAPRFILADPMLGASPEMINEECEISEQINTVTSSNRTTSNVDDAEKLS